MLGWVAEFEQKEQCVCCTGKGKVFRKLSLDRGFGIFHSTLRASWSSAKGNRGSSVCVVDVAVIWRAHSISKAYWEESLSEREVIQ